MEERRKGKGGGGVESCEAAKPHSVLFKTRGQGLGMASDCCCCLKGVWEVKDSHRFVREAFLQVSRACLEVDRGGNLTHLSGLILKQKLLNCQIFPLLRTTSQQSCINEWAYFARHLTQTALAWHSSYTANTTRTKLILHQKVPIENFNHRDDAPATESTPFESTRHFQDTPIGRSHP
ncbi:hypothetical protein CDAR_451261 [Caerostris darwini]|uniref:Uncharacterized protein n=1 Tax=Caerostris darwini TaxID=1538125 RepID=A0AAV4SYX9_9ARAC|nr:hypothetical protein CDAR_451261 [Caerostris darwini]